MTSFKHFQAMQTILANSFAGEYKSRDEVKAAAEQKGIPAEQFEQVLDDVLRAGALKPNL
ncbi:hypothetical protein [Aeromonas veronii]|uniref:hypothetical protein n=1 Tax=Aeromonas veronii TaxID=654 RepID=UPI001CD7DB34|nr:hypothetical protein [Aeromonas veronii]UBR47438.1 hypothetical protein LAG74_10170 [Aeromonas veronii]